MDYDKNAIVKLDTDGSVLKCAKGLASADCGFEIGGKVCAKCGAMPVQMKAAYMDETDEEDMVDDGADEDMEDAEGNIIPKKKKKALPAMSAPTDEEDMVDGGADEDMEDADGNVIPNPKKKKKPLPPMDEEEDPTDVAPDDEMEQMKSRRLRTMGYKSADVGARGYLCAIDRKVYPGGQTVCEDCVGGCMAEKGMPGLLHVEGIAEDMFDGKVLDSGYSAEADMFVVDVEAKDGRPIEVFIDGSSAEVLGWHKLDNNAFEQKSLVDEMMLIDFNDAAEIATKSIQGSVVAVEPDVFEGYDAYAVEIDGLDGKSYDVFVSLDGEVLGYDKYEDEDVEAIDAEVAEIALKRAFTEQQREEMAKDGTALSDGSFPISTKEDLSNAIQAFGRAKDKPAAKRHIMQRAKALGAESLIPATWVVGGKSDESTNEGGLDGNFMSQLLEFELLNSEVEESKYNSES